MASSTTSTARNAPLTSSNLLKNPTLIGFKEFHHHQKASSGAKMKTIRQVLFQESDVESEVDPVLEAVRELHPDPYPESSSDSQNYQSALTTSFSHYNEPAKDSFVTARISDATTAAGSINNIGEDPSASCEGSTGSEVSDESSSAGPVWGNLNKPHKANDSRWEAIRAVRAQDGGLGFRNFKLLKRLGCGDIGSVYLAELIGTSCYFAMKVMDKDALEARKKIPRAQMEREILQCLDHPFLPTLYTHFDTERFFCLVMEYCPGGDLHALRQKQPGKYFPEHVARFYAAEVLLALEYLHMLGIIYRDLKPENVLVREDGHIMLSDFDLSLRCAVSPTLVKSTRHALDQSSRPSGYCVEPSCIQQPSCMQPTCVQPTCFTPPRFLMNYRSKDISPKTKPRNNSDASTQSRSLPELIAEPTGARSMSFVGTHEYLAPEIIKGEGHGSAVDWWTFGVFLYELLFGKTPFKGSGNRATLFNVVGEPLKFPEVPSVSFASRDLIRGLLVKEPQQRLAYRRGATEVKQHPFFQSVNWALIRCASPPEIPRATFKKDGDVKTDGGYLDMDFF